MKESDRNFFKPLWRRVALTAVCAIWSIIEWIGHDQFWGTLTAAITAYCIWTYFIRFDATEAEKTEAGKTGPEKAEPEKKE